VIGTGATNHKGILQWRREIGLNSKYFIEKWEFIAKQQGEDSGWKIMKKKCQG
jgi:hypothetical protein